MRIEKLLCMAILGWSGLVLQGGEATLMSVVSNEGDTALQAPLVQQAFRELLLREPTEGEVQHYRTRLTPVGGVAAMRRDIAADKADDIKRQNQQLQERCSAWQERCVHLEQRQLQQQVSRSDTQLAATAQRLQAELDEMTLKARVAMAELEGIKATIHKPMSYAHDAPADPMKLRNTISVLYSTPNMISKNILKNLDVNEKKDLMVHLKSHVLHSFNDDGGLTSSVMGKYLLRASLVRVAFENLVPNPFRDSSVSAIPVFLSDTDTMTARRRAAAIHDEVIEINASDWVASSSVGRSEYERVLSRLKQLWCDNNEAIWQKRFAAQEPSLQCLVKATYALRLRLDAFPNKPEVIWLANGSDMKPDLCKDVRDDEDEAFVEGQILFSILPGIALDNTVFEQSQVWVDVPAVAASTTQASTTQVAE